MPGLSALLVCLATLVSCRGDARGDPTGASATLGRDGGDGTVGAKANNPPAVAARVTPAPAGGVASGTLPLDVRINLCQSSDPDPGDSIRFDVTWGDGVETGPGRPGAGVDPADAPTGCEGRDCCRHRHRYEKAGTFQVEARVSDKHLEDQANGVTAQAISRYRFVVTTGTLPEAGGAGCTTVTTDVGGLNGTSTNSTFETGAITALPTQGWINVSGTARVFDAGNGAIIGTAGYANYQVQYDTGVAIQPSTTYTLSLDMGYLAGLLGGDSGYSFQLGTLSGGVFTGLGAPITGTAPYPCAGPAGCGNLNAGVVAASAQQVFVTGATVSGASLAVRWAQTSSVGGGTSDFFGFDNVILRAARCAP